MKELRKYDIQHHGLSIGNHEFEYKLGKEFFDLFDFDDADKIDLTAKLDLEKQSTLLVLNFLIEGTLVFPCDLCIEAFEYPFKIEEKQIIKFGEQKFDQTEEIDVISLSANFVNIAKYIYEFVALAMPTKRVHSKGECNEDMLKKVGIYQTNKEEEEIIEVDPIWDQLKNLKF